MDEVSVRQARLEDLDQLLQFEQELIRAERPFDPCIRPDPVSYYDIKEFILDKDAEVVVAEVGGKIVSSGYATIKPARTYLDHQYYAYLGFMYTAAEFRGQGINQKILDVLKAWARSRGLMEVRLTVYESNQPAIRAYEKAGFAKHITEMRIDIGK